MSKRTPTEVARLCFRIAADERSPAGERAAALNRGMALLDRHKLNPDHFTIPGRERPRVQEFDLNVGPSPWGSAFDDFVDRAESMRAAGVAFSMDDLVREAVRESMRRRRERATASARAASPSSSRCRHGEWLYGARCATCDREAGELAQASRTCPHGHRADEWCGVCVMDGAR